MVIILLAWEISSKEDIVTVVLGDVLEVEVAAAAAVKERGTRILVSADLVSHRDISFVIAHNVFVRRVVVADMINSIKRVQITNPD